MPALAVPLAAGADVGWPSGVAFAAGIAYAITAGIAASSTTAVTADDVQGVILWP